MSCSISETQLTQRGMDLDVGLAIKARVSSMNAVGWSDSSDAANCNHMRHLSNNFTWLQRTPSLPAPKIYPEGLNSAKVCFDQCTGPRCSAYELSYAAAGRTRQTQRFEGRNHAPCHTLTNL